ncbi:MAG: helix-turn-helix domain-containing protein [Deltaproteobacteria bacterium]|nr:MAG: helix-turn-helix domain-containing protein [Deltaproteobacteria bacterium]TMB26159.1 MAG: helix-turn-helix domain-containing protein [Deltaproteobacteria bacterium]
MLPDFSTSLTVKEVAARLRVCTATVYRLCTAGRLALPASARASGSGRRT